MERVRAAGLCSSTTRESGGSLLLVRVGVRHHPLRQPSRPSAVHLTANYSHQKQKINWSDFSVFDIRINHQENGT